MSDTPAIPTRLSVALLSLSAAGLVGIAGHEGYRATTYADAGGKLTIGFGSTAGVQPGQSTDPVRALVRLQADASAVQVAMRACIGAVPIAPHEWDAYTSLAYNIGAGAFCRSTLVRKLRAQPPDYPGACAEILRWNRVGGVTLSALTRRRTTEHARCMGVGA